MGRGAWVGSDRATRLPSNWPTIKREVAKRAKGRCEADHHHPDCDGIGAECDHIKAGDNHNMGNLQWLSKPCHKAKTANESAQRNRERARLRRRVERHPGLIE